ncbi:DsrE family protein [Defluviitalea phaphyphila]|uniref:DsrE family protein n=1 Tax=Defluviitalea phaphyphila TaxID=1473580 RepID=UPI000731B500|nr:DsrE family protein [Defluviitalea phaphyphila]
MSEYKVIFHIDEINKWNLLLKNVSNLLNSLDSKNISVEVLANSEAVKYYDFNSNLDIDIKTMENLNKKGVKFVACNNSLRGNGIKKEDIITFVDTVPTGVLELIKRQKEGYAYIKP